MKKIIAIVAGLAILLLISVRIFSSFESSNILSNQSVFKIYLDIEKNRIDNLFSLPKGTFDESKMNIICRVPAINNLEKPYYQAVHFNNNIDCNEEYQKNFHRKYESYELSKVLDMNFELVLINNDNTPLLIYDEALNSNNIIAKYPFNFNYKTGKINHIIISQNEIFDKCQ